MRRPGESPEPAGDVDRAPDVLIVAARFPSRIQPWLLNQIEQVLIRGGQVRIVARGPLTGPYQPKVDELGLLERTEYYPDGLGGVVGGLARVAADPGPGGRRAREGLRRLSRSRARPRSAREWVKAAARASVFAARPGDVVHSHSLSQAYEYRRVAPLNGIPFVHTFHGMSPKGVTQLSESKRLELFRSIDLVLVNTRFARGQVEALGASPERIEILPQGILLAEFPYVERPPRTGGVARLLTVARLQPDKGIEHAIRAVGLLSSRGYEVRYVVIGDGPDEARLRSLATDVGVASQMTFAGRVGDEELRRAYGEADIFLLPSVGSGPDDHTETQGVVVQEAQASGAIVAASRVGGVPECVDDGVSAFLFDDRNPDAIAMTVASILDQPERWGEWRSGGRAWVERHFDMNRLGARLCRTYARVVAERHEPDRKKSRRSQVGDAADSAGSRDITTT